LLRNITEMTQAAWMYYLAKIYLPDFGGST